ncbi:MAG: hypothetical protein HWE21_11520 [Cytophagia bacterium]|nr:hypothetical protein [Cytophagia bacterium]
MGEIFNESTRQFLVNIYAWYVFVPAVVGFFLLKRLNKIQKLIFYIALLSAINHKVSQIVRNVVEDHYNGWVYHIYVPILFWLTWRTYKEELKDIYSERFFQILLGVCLSFFVLNSFYIQNLRLIPTNGIFVISGVFIFWGFSYFYSLLKQSQFKSLEKEPVFWFTTGVLMYYSSTVLIFLLVYNYLEQGSEATYIAAILNAFFNLILVTSYLISLWVKPPK